MKKIGIIFGVFCLVLSTVSISYASSSTSSKEKIADLIAGIVGDAYEEIKIIEFGGEENYEKMLKLVNSESIQEQQKEQINSRFDLNNIVANNNTNCITQANIYDPTIDYLKDKIKAKLEEINSQIIGGNEVYCLQKQMFNSAEYQEDYEQFLDSLLETNELLTETSEETSNVTTVAMDNFSYMLGELNETPKMGDPYTKYTILVYEEALCPYCKRQYNDGTIEKLMNNFDDTNMVVRHFVVHPPVAQTVAEGIECIAAELGDDSFFTAWDKAFAYDSLTADSIYEIADEMGVSTTNFEACMNGEMTERVNNQLEEGKNVFNISGTPTTIILDTDTGEFVKIVGAQQYENFAELFEELRTDFK